jgi:multidrug efflux pump subunit AcrA (membrane-fusion protein)
MTMLNWQQKKLLRMAVATVGVCVVAVVAIVGAARMNSDGAGLARAGTDPAESGEGGAIEVNVIRPKREPTFEVTTQRPATVRAYYKEELYSQVAGRIKTLHVDIGSEVKEGQLLIDIDVPDLAKERDVKQAIVGQREEDLAVARVNVRVAQARANAAAKKVEAKNAQVEETRATQVYRAKRFRRLQRLVGGGGATQEAVDEEEEFLLAVNAAVTRAQIEVLEAQEDAREAHAKFDAANADVKLKQAWVEVAKQDRDKAQVPLHFAQIRAPFNSKVKERPYDVNPGTFVQNATTAGHPEPLLTVERTDIVTIMMQVPDTYAPYVDKGTEAVIEMSELRGQLIHGKVTRFDPSLETSTNDRTMGVQVDLYNDSWQRYKQWLAEEKAKAQQGRKPFDDLKDGPLPIFPTVTGQNAGNEPPHLYPGMYGEMTLVLRKGFEKYYFVPSDAIVRAGGTPYVFVVKDGVAHEVPVKVMVENGKVANIRFVVTTPHGEEQHDLTGDERIVYSNQAELTDGQTVSPVSKDW